MASSFALPSIAVIGAGMSGLICARTLAGRGFPVRVFEKGRGAGGRMSTRRTSAGFEFDHGAQYFTARDPEFLRYAASWVEEGFAAEWPGRIVSVGRTGIDDSRRGESKRRFVGIPGMDAICRHLGDGLPVHFGVRVASVRRAGSGCRLVDGEGEPLGVFDVVVAAVPAPQASELLVEATALSEAAGSVRMTGCWALMAAFEQPVRADFDGAFVRDSALSWMARNSSKPGRNSGPDCWVCHASAEWSELHLEESGAWIAEHLLPEFFSATGLRPSGPVYCTAHRWRYAIPPEPLPDRCLFDDRLAIGACGDWCSGPRVEGAFLSGMSMAGRVIASYGL